MMRGREVVDHNVCVEYKDHKDLNDNASSSVNKNYEKEIQEKKVMLSAGIDQPIISGIDLGERIECSWVECPNCGKRKLKSMTVVHDFRFTKIRIVPFKFEVYYLDRAFLRNYSDDETEFMGNNQYSVLNGTDKEFNVGDVSSVEKLKKLINTTYGTSTDGERFNFNLVACTDEKGWHRPDPNESTDPSVHTETETSYYSGRQYLVTYNNMVCNGYFGYSNLISYEGNIFNLPKIIHQTGTVYTDPEAPGNKYNGERLSIAQAVYNIYIRDKVKKDLELIDITPDKYKQYENQFVYMTQESEDFKEKIEEENTKIIENGGPSSVPNDGYLSSRPTSECSDSNSWQIRGKNENVIGYQDTVQESAVTAFSNTSGVNIVNPATLSEIEVISNKNIVAQTLGEDNSFNLQVGSETRVIPKLATNDNVYGTLLSFAERKAYIKYYIYEFNFPVQYNGRDYAPNTPIVVDVSGKSDSNNDETDRRGEIVFVPNGTNSKKGDYTTTTIDIRTDKITVTAVTKNIPANSITEVEELYKKAKNYEKYFTISDANICSDGDRNDVTRNNYSDTLVGYGRKIRNDSNYFSNKVSTSTSNISRVYDFEVTDCTDVNFKSIFRKNENGVNVHTGNIYFGGIRRLNVFNYDDSNNNLVPNYNMTLPLGPYKQDDGYVDAPKIGYRISFDLKTSGFYDYTSSEKNQKRTIVILPKFYYISKDGNTFYDNVDAYYKDSSGKYKKLTQISIPSDENALKRLYQNYADGSGELSGYKIEYTPNDGYRNVLNIGITNVDDKFSKDKHTLDMSALVLTEKMMCANYDGFIQSWYGEYKLPNSTILVESGKEPNSNNILDKGYLGVVFNIGVVEQQKGDISNSKTVVITYNTPNKKATSSINTSQWDYEGYLGFSNAGSALNGNLQLQLANGTWNINNARYQQVKGTVVLFDLDNRAASDFE